MSNLSFLNKVNRQQLNPRDRAFKVQKPDQDIVRNVQTMGPASLDNQNIQPIRTAIGLQQPFASQVDRVETGLDALKDKWHLLQISPVPSRNPGQETRLNSFRHEFVFEKKINN